MIILLPRVTLFSGKMLYNYQMAKNCSENYSRNSSINYKLKITITYYGVQNLQNKIVE